MKKLPSFGNVLKRGNSGEREPPGSARGDRNSKKPNIPPFKAPIQRAGTTVGAPEENTPRKKKIFDFKKFNPLKSPMPSGAQSARVHGTDTKRSSKKKDAKKDKKKKDTSSSSSSEESVGNVFPASLTQNHPPPHHTGETK